MQVAFCHDLTNRLTLPTETSTAIVMLGICCMLHYAIYYIYSNVILAYNVYSTNTRMRINTLYSYAYTYNTLMRIHIYIRIPI